MKLITKTIHNESIVAEEVIAETAPHSIELSRNAKGQYSWSIKVYFREEDKQTIVDEVDKINDQLIKKYPLVDDLAKLAELDKKAKK